MNLTWITPLLAIGGRLSDAEALRLASDEEVGAVVDLPADRSADAAGEGCAEDGER